MKKLEIIKTFFRYFGHSLACENDRPHIKSQSKNFFWYRVYGSRVGFKTAWDVAKFIVES